MPSRPKKKPVDAPTPPQPSPGPVQPVPQTELGGSEWEVAKLHVKPADQLELSAAELEQEITRVLRAELGSAPDNITRFSHKDKAFKLDASIDHTRLHFSEDGRLLHLDSSEAQQQHHQQQEEQAALEREMERQRSEGAAEPTEDEVPGLRNQFNFQERTQQTMSKPTRERGTMTAPPGSCEFSAQTTQWEMFDSYRDDQLRKQDAARLKTAKAEVPSAINTVASKPPVAEEIIHGETMGHAAKILERMVNQNTHDEINLDFKFWEDASDQFREGEGSLLPLWKFCNERAKRKHVTAVRWSPEYPDLFAVGYGSFDYLKQGGGMLCLFSLKNPTFPELNCVTESGVMCLDWHPQHSSLLCVGLYDGTLSVYDTRARKQAPIFRSSVSGRHTDPVWEVCWQEEDVARSLNFFSISTDGRITLWTLSKSELEHSDLMHLKLLSAPLDADVDDDSALCGLASGCCFDFSRLSEHLFLVGTEEGKIHKCSKAYDSQYLETYEGHYMAVYTVRWNPFNPKVFVSCSADWSVRVWVQSRLTPLISLDLSSQVGDVAWAPWSSTTFAACTADGKLRLFDLNENRSEPMCEQKVVRKAKLTKLAFHAHADQAPIVLVGDEQACVSSLKLSPNLRCTALSQLEAAEAKKAREAAAQAAASINAPRRGLGSKKSAPEQPQETKRDGREMEVEKLDRIIEMQIKSLLDAG